MADRRRRSSPAQSHSSSRRKHESSRRNTHHEEMIVPEPRSQQTPQQPRSSYEPANMNSSFIPTENQDRGAYPASYSSSSSSSLIDISRTFPPNRSGIRTFFTAPSEHRRKLRKRRSRRLFKIGNSSSSSVNSDLAYGTGFIKRPKSRIRSREGKKIERERYPHKYGEQNYDPRYSDRERERINATTNTTIRNDGRDGRSGSSKAATDAEILAVGAELARLAREQNRLDLKTQRSGQKSGFFGTRETGHGLTSSRGLGPSKVSHGSDTLDEDGWESASDDESDQSVDSRLAYDNNTKGGWRLFGRKKFKPLSRKNTIVDPRLFGPANSLHGIVTQPVGFGEVSSWTSVSDFGQQAGYSSTAGPVDSRNNSQQSLQQVYPVPTSNPDIFAAGRISRGSAISGPEPLPYSSNRPGPIPLQQPQPITPVSQSVYEPIYPTGSESGGIPKKTSSSSRPPSLAQAALAGVAGAAVGAAIVGSRDDRKDRQREEELRDRERQKRRESERAEAVRESERREAEKREFERRELERRDAERHESERREAERRDIERRDIERRELEKKESERRRDKRGSPDRDDSKDKRHDKDKKEETDRDKKRGKRRNETRDERDERRREERRTERGDRIDERVVDVRPVEERRAERPELVDRRTKSEASVSSTSVDPFQYQIRGAETPSGGHTPTVVTVDREPDFARMKSYSVKDPISGSDARVEVEYSDKDEREKRYRSRESRDAPLHEAEDIYEETKHFTAPIAVAAIGAAIAAEHHRESRSDKRRDERRSGSRSDYDSYDYDHRDRKQEKDREAERIQEEADRAYREIVMARKIASQVIRSRSPSPDRSVVDKYKDQEEEIVRIVTPPGMEEHKQKGPYDAPNADFQLDHVIQPKEMHIFKVPSTNYGRPAPEPVFEKRDPDAERPRPLLNLVYPTPTPSPMPEKQKERSDPVRSEPKSKERDQPKDNTSDVVIGPRGNVVASPTASTVSKGVTWGENETKHYEVESPSDHRDEFVSAADLPAREVPQEIKSSGSKSKGWGAIAAGIMGAGIGAAAASSSDTSKSSKSKKDDDKKSDTAYEYRGVVVEPESPPRRKSPPRRERDQSPPSPGPKPASPRSSHIPGAFDDDLDFTATVAAGLQDTGFDPNIVINDESFRRRDSPPGSNGPSLYHAPFAETVSDLGAIPPSAAGSVASGFILGEVVSTPRDWQSVSPVGEEIEIPTKLSKKEQKKRDKQRRQSGDITPLEESSSTREVVEEPITEPINDYFVEPKLSKKEQKRRDKEAARQAALAEEIKPTVAEEIVESPESFFEVPKKSKKSKRSSTSPDDVVESPSEARTVSVPVDAFDDLKNGNDDWTDTKSKKKKKRDSDRFDSPIQSAVPDVISSEVSSSKKSKRDSDRYESPPRSAPIYGAASDIGGTSRSKRDSERYESPPRSRDAVSDIGYSSSTKEKSRRVSERYESPPRSTPIYGAASEIGGTSRSKRDSERYGSPPRSQDAVSEVGRSSSSKDKSKRRSGQYERDPEEVSLPPSTPSEAGDYDDRKSRKSSNRDSGIFSSTDRDMSQSVVSADASRYDDAEPRRKKKSRSGRDDYDDTRSVASAPAGDYDDSRKSSKKKDKEKDKKSGIFSSIFGSKSDLGARDDSPKGAKDDDDRKKSKKSKRHSVPDSSSIYGGMGAESVGDLSRSVSNGGNGKHHMADDLDDGVRSDGEKRRKSRSRSESTTSTKKDSFLGNAGTLGAGVGIAGAAVAIAAQQHRQSKAANTNNETAEHSRSLSAEGHMTRDEILDPEIAERQFRPSIDPQYGDLLPLPPSDPTSPSVEPTEELPELPDSRPDTPEAERISRDKGISSIRRTLQDTPMKSPSQSAVPLVFKLGNNRSMPSSPGFARSSPGHSPATPTAESLGFPKNRQIRPTSWDKSTEYKPLWLPEVARRGSTSQLQESHDPYPELPPSETTSRSSSLHDFHDALEDPQSDNRSRSESLSLDTKLASASAGELLDSTQTTPKAHIFPKDINGPESPEQVFGDATEYHDQPGTREKEPHSIGKEVATIGAGAGLVSALGYFASTPNRSTVKSDWMDDLPSAKREPSPGGVHPDDRQLAENELPTIARQPSPIDPVSKDRSSYLLRSSPMSRKNDEEKDTLHNIEERETSGFSVPTSASARDIEEERQRALETLSTPREEIEDPVKPTGEFGENADEFVFKSKKDKKKDKKKGKGLSRSSTQDDLPMAKGSRDVSQEPETVPAIEQKPFDEFVMSKPKKDKKKGKGLSRSSTQDDMSSLSAREEVLPETKALVPATTEPEPAEELITMKSKKDKKKDKKKNKSASAWEPEEGETTKPAEETEDAFADIPTSRSIQESEIQQPITEPETIPSARMEPTLVEEPTIESADQFSTPKSKKDKKKDKKKNKLASAWEPEENVTAKPVQETEDAFADIPTSRGVQEIEIQQPVPEPATTPSTRTESTLEEPTIETADDFSMLKSKKDKKKDKKNRKSSFVSVPELLEDTQQASVDETSNMVVEEPSASRDIQDGRAEHVEEPNVSLSSTLDQSQESFDDFSPPKSKKDKKKDKKKKSTLSWEPERLENAQDEFAAESNNVASGAPSIPRDVQEFTKPIREEPAVEPIANLEQSQEVEDDLPTPESEKGKKKDKKSDSTWEPEASENLPTEPVPETSTPAFVEETPITRDFQETYFDQPIVDTPLVAAESPPGPSQEFSAPKSKKDKKKRKSLLNWGAWGADSSEPTPEPVEESIDQSSRDVPEPAVTIQEQSEVVQPVQEPATGPADEEFSAPKSKKDKKKDKKKKKTTLAWEPEPDNFEDAQEQAQESVPEISVPKSLVGSRETSNLESVEVRQNISTTHEPETLPTPIQTPVDLPLARDIEDPSELLLPATEPELLSEKPLLISEEGDSYAAPKSKKDKKKSKKDKAVLTWPEDEEVNPVESSKDVLQPENVLANEHKPAEELVAEVSNDVSISESILASEDKKASADTTEIPPSAESKPLDSDEPTSTSIEKPLDEPKQAIPDPVAVHSAQLADESSEQIPTEISAPSEAEQFEDFAPKPKKDKKKDKKKGKLTPAWEAEEEQSGSQIPAPLDASRDVSEQPPAFEGTEQSDGFSTSKSKKDKKKDKKKGKSIASWDEPELEQPVVSDTAVEETRDVTEELPTSTPIVEAEDEFPTFVSKKDSKKDKKKGKSIASCDEPEPEQPVASDTAAERAQETTEESPKPSPAVEIEDESPAFVSKKDKKKDKKKGKSTSSWDPEPEQQLEEPAALETPVGETRGVIEEPVSNTVAEIGDESSSFATKKDKKRDRKKSKASSSWEPEPEAQVDEPMTSSAPVEQNKDMIEQPTSAPIVEIEDEFAAFASKKDKKKGKKSKASSSWEPEPEPQLDEPTTSNTPVEITQDVTEKTSTPAAEPGEEFSSVVTKKDRKKDKKKAKSSSWETEPEPELPTTSELPSQPAEDIIQEPVVPIEEAEEEFPAFTSKKDKKKDKKKGKSVAISEFDERTTSEPVEQSILEDAPESSSTPIEESTDTFSMPKSKKDKKKDKKKGKPFSSWDPEATEQEPEQNRDLVEGPSSISFGAIVPQDDISSKDIEPDVTAILESDPKEHEASQDLIPEPSQEHIGNSLSATNENQDSANVRPHDHDSPTPELGFGDVHQSQGPVEDVQHKLDIHDASFAHDQHANSGDIAAEIETHQDKISVPEVSGREIQPDVQIVEPETSTPDEFTSAETKKTRKNKKNKSTAWEPAPEVTPLEETPLSAQNDVAEVAQSQSVPEDSVNKSSKKDKKKKGKSVATLEPEQEAPVSEEPSSIVTAPEPDQSRVPPAEEEPAFTESKKSKKKKGKSVNSWDPEPEPTSTPIEVIQEEKPIKPSEEFATPSSKKQKKKSKKSQSWDVEDEVPADDVAEDDKNKDYFPSSAAVLPVAAVGAALLGAEYMHDRTASEDPSSSKSLEHEQIQVPTPKTTEAWADDPDLPEIGTVSKPVPDGLTAGYANEQLSLARQLQEEFASGSKKSKKDKSKRKSLPVTPVRQTSRSRDVDHFAEDHHRARSLSIEPATARSGGSPGISERPVLYSTEQLELARQLKEEFASGSKKSKKDKKKKRDVFEDPVYDDDFSRDALEEPQAMTPGIVVDTQEPEARDTPRGDGFAAGYQEDQLSLARQLQADFNKKSKKDSKKDKKRRSTSQTPLEQEPAAEDYFGETSQPQYSEPLQYDSSQNALETDSQEKERVHDGLAVGYKEDQLELARQLKEEFASGSKKKLKKDKKRSSLLRGTTEDEISSDAFIAESEQQSGLASPLDEGTRDASIEPEDAFPTVSKKSKKDKKGKKRGTSLLRGTVDDDLTNETTPDFSNTPNEIETPDFASTERNLDGPSLAEPTLIEPEEESTPVAKKSKKDKKGKKRDSIVPAEESKQPESSAQDISQAQTEIPQQESTEKEIEQPLLAEPEDDFAPVSKKVKKDKKVKRRDSFKPEAFEELSIPENLGESASKEAESNISTTEEIAAVLEPASQDISLPAGDDVGFATTKKSKKDKKNRKSIASNEEPLAQSTAETESPSWSPPADEPSTANVTATNSGTDTAAPDEFSLGRKLSKKDKKRQSLLRSSTFDEPPEQLSMEQDAQPEIANRHLAETIVTAPLEEPHGDEFEFSSKRSKKDKKKQNIPREASFAETVQVEDEVSYTRQPEIANDQTVGRSVEPSSFDESAPQLNLESTEAPDVGSSLTPFETGEEAPAEDMFGDFGFTKKPKKDKKKRKDSAKQDSNGPSGSSTPMDPGTDSIIIEEQALPLEHISEPASQDLPTITNQELVDEPVDEWAFTPSKKSKKDKKGKRSSRVGSEAPSGTSTPIETLAEPVAGVKSELPEHDIQESIPHEKSTEEETDLPSTAKDIQEPGEEWGSLSTKKSKKDKKKRKSGLSTPIEEPLLEPQQFSEYVAESSVPKEITNEDLSKEDPLSRDLESSAHIPQETPANLPVEVVQTPTETVETRELETSTPENKGTALKPEHDEWAPASKKSKKDKKKRKSGISTPIEKPVLDETNEQSALPEIVPEVIETSTEPIHDREVTPPLEPSTVEPEGDWGNLSRKASKKDKKKRKSGLSTPIEETMPSDVKEEVVAGPSQATSSSQVLEESTERGIDEQDATIIPELLDVEIVPHTPVVEAEGEWSSLSRKSSKKDKKKRKSGLSTPVEEPTSSDFKEQVIVGPIQTTASSQVLEESMERGIDDQYTAIPIESSIAEAEGEWSSLSRKSSKKDKKKRKSGLLTPTEQPLFAESTMPDKTTVKNELNESSTVDREIVDAQTEEPLLRQDENIAARQEKELTVQEQEPVDELAFVTKRSKKDKKGKKASRDNSEPELSSFVLSGTSGPIDLFPKHDTREVTPEIPVRQTSSPVPFERDEKVKEAPATDINADTTFSTHHEAADTFTSDISRKPSKKDKRKRQTTIIVGVDDGPSTAKAPLTSWADEVEEAEVVREHPIIEDLAKDETLSHIPSTTESTPVDDFVRPSKKGKKGKKRNSSQPDPADIPPPPIGADLYKDEASDNSSSIPALAALAAGAGLAGATLFGHKKESPKDTSMPEATAPVRKLSKKEKRKQSIDKRTPKDDMFDDPSLWEGEKPRAYEESRSQEEGDDGFWSPPHEAEQVERAKDIGFEEKGLVNEAPAQESKVDVASHATPQQLFPSFAPDAFSKLEAMEPMEEDTERKPETHPTAVFTTHGGKEISGSESQPKDSFYEFVAPRSGENTEGITSSLESRIYQDNPHQDSHTESEERSYNYEPPRSIVTTPPQEENISFERAPPITEEHIFTPRSEHIESHDADRSFHDSPGDFRQSSPLSSRKYARLSDLPVVHEETLESEQHPSGHHYDATASLRDSAYESPIPPQRGFSDLHEHVRDSGVHLRDFSPAEKRRAPISSTDDAIARLSWPPVDEETETVDLNKSQRPKGSKKHYEDAKRSIEIHDSSRPKGEISTDFPRSQNASEEKPLLHHDDVQTSRDTLPSQRVKEETHNELHRTPTIHGARRSNQGSIVQQRLQKFESPDAVRATPPRAGNFVKQRVQGFETPDSHRVQKLGPETPDLPPPHKPAFETPKSHQSDRSQPSDHDSPEYERSKKPKADKYFGLKSDERPKAEKPKGFGDLETGVALAGAATLGFAAARKLSQEQRPGSAQSIRSASGGVGRLRTPDLHRPDSVNSNRSGTPPLRRSDRKVADLRSLSQRSKLDLAKEAELAAITASSTSTNSANPTANEGRVRAKDMADVYDGFGEGRIGSPRSPTRPHSMRRRQSMQVLELENRVEQLAADNRMLAEFKAQAERNLHASQSTASALVEKDAEIDALKRTLDWLQNEVGRLTEVNEGLTSANTEIARQHADRYGLLETQHAQATRELQETRNAHTNLSSSVEGMVRSEVQKVVLEKDQEIAQLRAQLDAAKEKIRDMQRQILASKANDVEFLTIRDEDYFDNACQQLCQHVQQWVLRFSKFSDMRACRLTREINNDKTIDRLDNAILDGSDVDIYLGDRVKRRDIFMSMTMTMVWEFIFTRYLFGMDREQRQKLKSLEKTLSEVGPAAAVHSWRATTLTLLSKREAFKQQREQDTQAVVHAILETLSEILPPPSNLEAQIEEQLTRVMKAAVDLSIEMRCQRAEYMMLPPLQPEYDANGDLASKVSFNAALMNERSGDTVSNEDLEAQKAVVRIVLFPLVVKKGDDSGEGDEEIVVCPAQVLVAKGKRARFTDTAQSNHSRMSMQSSMPADAGENVI